MAYYVFRVNYDEDYKLIRNEIIKNGKLRQGWGSYEMRADVGYEMYRDSWRKTWGNNDSEESIKSRHRIISRMTEIKPDDYILIPKMSIDIDQVSRCFTIARCKKAYQFGVLDEVGDYGHYIEIEDAFTCEYSLNLFTQTVASKFSGYQAAVNRVWNDDFILAIESLIAVHNKNPNELEAKSDDFHNMIQVATNKSRKEYLSTIVDALRKLENKSFEKLIEKLFEKNGYSVVRRNWFDGEGGDADIVFDTYNDDSLMSNIYEASSTEKPHIYVQAKKKTGIDFDDINGVNQLIQIYDTIQEKNATLIVINLTNKFTEDAKLTAMEYGIILIDGMTFASLLVRYGIGVEII